MRVWTFVTLLLAGLGLLLGAAYTLEIPPRRGADAILDAGAIGYVYRQFGWASPAIQVFAVFAAIGLTVMARGSAVFRLVLAGTIALGFSMAVWAVTVAPAYAAWFEAAGTNPGSLPEIYRQVGGRWENGQLAAFLSWLVGFTLILLASVRAEEPEAVHDAHAEPAI